MASVVAVITLLVLIAVELRLATTHHACASLDISQQLLALQAWWGVALPALQEATLTPLVPHPVPPAFFVRWARTQSQWGCRRLPFALSAQLEPTALLLAAAHQM